MSFEALDLLVFKPVKCPEIAPVLVFFLPSPATLLNLSSAFFCETLHAQKMQQNLARSGRGVSGLRFHKDHGHICLFQRP